MSKRTLISSGRGLRKECPEVLLILVRVWKETEFLSSDVDKLMKQRDAEAGQGGRVPAPAPAQRSLPTLDICVTEQMLS